MIVAPPALVPTIVAVPAAAVVIACAAGILARAALHILPVPAFLACIPAAFGTVTLLPELTILARVAAPFAAIGVLTRTGIAACLAPLLRTLGITCGVALHTLALLAAFLPLCLAALGCGAFCALRFPAPAFRSCTPDVGAVVAAIDLNRSPFAAHVAEFAGIHLAHALACGTLLTRFTPIAAVALGPFAAFAAFARLCFRRGGQGSDGHRRGKRAQGRAFHQLGQVHGACPHACV